MGVQEVSLGTKGLWETYLRANGAYWEHLLLAVVLH